MSSHLYLSFLCYLHTPLLIAVIDEACSSLPSHDLYGNSGKYEFAESGGEGVDAYIIDTGISINHVDFHGRAKVGVACRRPPPCGPSEYLSNVD